MIFLVKCIRHEMKKAFMQWETWVVIAVCFAIMFLGLAEHFIWFEDYFIEPARPRSDRYMLVSSSMGYIYALVLAPLLASIPCACSYYREKESHADIILAAKFGRGKYYIGKLIAVALTGFIVSVLPLVLQYIICMIFMPEGDIYYLWFSVYDSLESYNDMVINTTVFPNLYMNHQDLSVFIHIALCGAWTMGLAMLTYTISLYFRKNIVITLTASTIFNIIYMLVMDILGLAYLIPGNYFYPGSGTSGTNFIAFVIVLAVLILINIALLTIKLVTRKDIV